MLVVLMMAAFTACSGPDSKDLNENIVESGSSTVEEVVEAELAGMFPASDLALVGQTGRPQFLNTYAEW